MNNNIRVICDYFNNIPEFSLIPKYFRNRIVSFFLEERHFMVDPVDVKCFLDGGKRFAVFMTFEELSEFSRVHSLRKVLGCRRYFASHDKLIDWMERFSKLETNDEIWVLTHSIGFEFDQPEEWYIAYF